MDDCFLRRHSCLAAFCVQANNAVLFSPLPALARGATQPRRKLDRSKTKIDLRAPLLGYTHTAYAMFHETRIDQKGPTYESDAKAGHLIFLLERALIFNQLEQHSTLVKTEDISTAKKKSAQTQIVSRVLQGLTLEALYL